MFAQIRVTRFFYKAIYSLNSYTYDREYLGQMKIKAEIWHSILHECCPFVGNVFYLCDAEQSALHIDESVFISPSEEMW